MAEGEPDQTSTSYLGCVTRALGGDDLVAEELRRRVEVSCLMVKEGGGEVGGEGVDLLDA